MKNKKLILSVIAVAAILAFSLTSLAGCALFRKNDINELADELFPMLFSNDVLSSNFFFEDADSALGLTPKAGLSAPSTKEDYYEAYSSYKTQAALMATTYRYSKMSDADKDLFTFLQNFFIDQSLFADFYYLQDDYIGGYSGMQASLPIYLTEYKFRDEQDIKDYIVICNQTTDVFPTWVDYEIDRIENGYARPRFVLFYAIEQAENFTGAKILGEGDTMSEMLQAPSPDPADYPKNDDNFVLRNALQKIDDCSFLNDERKTSYKAQITEAVKTMIRAYVRLGNEIKDVLTNPTYQTIFDNMNGGLAMYGKTGRDYYEALFKYSTGTRDGISAAAKTVYAEYEQAVKELDALRNQLASKLSENGITTDADAYVVDYFNNDKWDLSSLYSTIDTLKGVLSPDFPAFAGNADKVTLKIVDESVKDNFAPAAYFVSPLDNPDSAETIIINNWDSTGYLSYDLLSHEGIPGHLYQYNYLKNSDKHNIVKVLCPTAYKEGWATYAEHYSAEKYGARDGIDNLVMRYQVKKVLVQGYIRVLGDMKVNYDGAGTDELEKWLTDTLKINEHPSVLSSFTADEETGKLVLVRRTVKDFANNVAVNAVLDPANAATYYYSYIQVKNIISGLQNKGYSVYDAHKAFLDSPYTFTQIKEKYGL